MTSATVATIAPVETPNDALDFIQLLAEAAAVARRAGWNVNMAFDTGGDAERINFAAQRQNTPGATS